MTPNQINTLKMNLEARRRELIQSLTSRDDIRIERVSDTLDEIQNATHRDLAVAQINRNSKLLNQIDAALQRIKDGTYGECRHCEEEINPKRLAAIPWASLCLTCQERVDMEGTHDDIAEPVFAGGTDGEGEGAVRLLARAA
jgi:DnaK suppressor protein